MKLIKNFLKKSWLTLKLKVFFTTNKKKITANRLIAGQFELALTGRGPKKSNFFRPKIL